MNYRIRAKWIKWKSVSRVLDAHRIHIKFKGKFLFFFFLISKLKGRFYKASIWLAILYVGLLRSNIFIKCV